MSAFAMPLRSQTRTHHLDFFAAGPTSRNVQPGVSNSSVKILRVVLKLYLGLAGCNIGGPHTTAGIEALAALKTDTLHVNLDSNRIETSHKRILMEVKDRFGDIRMGDS
jgi:hypothetical protein